MTDPVSAGLDLIAELRRMQLRALVLVHRAKSARVHARQGINTKAGAPTPAMKEDHS